MLKLNPRSIHFRLTAWYAAILAATFCAIAIFVPLTLRHSVRVTVDKELRARLTAVRSYVEQESASEGASHLREELNEDAVVSVDAAYLRITDRNGSFLYRSPNTMKWPPTVPTRESLPSRGLFGTILVKGDQVRLLSAPVKIGVVQVGLPLDEFDEIQQGFMRTIAFGLPLLLCVACIGGYWLSGRALRPVDEIASAAKRITAQNLSERLPASRTGDELDRLSQVLNEMLAGLDSAFKRITQFTADASHELRTPLAIIRTTAEVIRGRIRTAEEHDKAWLSVLAQSERSSQLVDDLLTLTRADSGSGALQFEAADLGTVVSAACSEMQVLADTKDLHLSFGELAPCSILCDSDGLRRAITVLLDNAMKATVAGGQIRVSSTVGERSQHPSAIVEVTDTGCGIPREDLAHIFDRFYRVNKDRSRETGGAGLGLSIAQWIVAGHRGTIEVASELGRGSTFRIVLPLEAQQHRRSEILQNQSAS